MSDTNELHVAVSDSRDGTVVVVAAGECDLMSAPALELALRGVADDNREVELDLSGLGFLDSSTLHMLWKVNQDFEATGVRLVLVSPSPIVRRALSISALDASFEIRDAD